MTDKKAEVREILVSFHDKIFHNIGEEKGKPVKCSTCDESFEKQRIENTNKLLDKLAKQEPRSCASQ